MLSQDIGQQHDPWMKACWSSKQLPRFAQQIVWDVCLYKTLPGHTATSCRKKLASNFMTSNRTSRHAHWRRKVATTSKQKRNSKIFSSHPHIQGVGTICLTRHPFDFVVGVWLMYVDSFSLSAFSSHHTNKNLFESLGDWETLCERGRVVRKPSLVHIPTT